MDVVNALNYRHLALPSYAGEIHTLFPLGCPIIFCDSLVDLHFPAPRVSRVLVLPSAGFPKKHSACCIFHLSCLDYENLSLTPMLVSPVCYKDKLGIKT